MYIKRELENRLKKVLPKKEVISIVGPRQTGKTTLLKRIKEKLDKKEQNVQFITFEKRADLDLFEEVEDFKRYYQDKDAILIDEFQYAENGGQKLKYLYDTTDIKFIVTGSSSLDLVHKTGKYMVGRMFSFNLYPFSFREFLRYKDKNLLDMLTKNFENPLKSFNPQKSFGKSINQKLENLLEEYLIYGGYPRVVTGKEKEEKELVLESNLENYLQKEIKDLLNLASDKKLFNLAKTLATQIGELINYNNLSNVTELSYQKTKEHLNILEKTYILNLIRPFYTNKRTEITKNPVPYFIDTGFRNHLINDFRSFKLRNDKGALMENFVFMVLQRKTTSNLREINYWRSKSQAEVDFVIQDEQKPIPIEVKYSKNPTPGKSFYSFLNKYDCKKSFILTNGVSKRIKKKGAEINFIPVYYL